MGNEQSLDLRDRCCVPRLLSAALEQMPPDTVLRIRIDIHPVAEVRKVLERSGWNIVEKLFLPEAREFRLIARRKAS